ncbi:FAD binding domain-containing protein, partial [Cryomyces antarcticus]
VHDVIIIGAGPAGLAVTARLCEHTPSAIFTDKEHQRYHWIRKNGTKTTILNQRNKTTKPAESSCGNVSTLVLDATADTWMAKWNMLLKKFEIEYVRSPMFFHPDSGDRDGLFAFTHEQDREQDL